MFKNIKAVFIFTDRPVESALWCSQLFGPSIKIKEDNFCLIQIGDIELCFHLADSKSPQSTGGSVSYWNVTNFQNTLNKAISLGAKIYRGPLKIEEEDNRWIAQIKDPNGNIIGIDGPK
ncbi:MAG: hypothetical protein KAG61_06110 [Bacteriovoracaceae bacterium]|nr:hypothetical protein [Bacteriovoracaceae bacterium]